MSAVVGLLAFTEVEELDLIGPWEIFKMWHREPGGPERVFLVAESLDPVACAKGLRILPDFSYDECTDLDYLLVPGGFGTRREVDNRATIEFIARKARGCLAVLSVCTGAFLIEKAGLLAGRRATTHWRSLDRLRGLGVEVVEARFVRDGNIWTSAGVSAGIDMALAFIASAAGREVAGRVQLNVEYYPDPTVYRGEDAPEWTPGYLERA